ncbi:MAG TPA: hypothetical protein VFF70_10815, partial [Anaerolineae bacterium]|nr:hypothetical protein [Anaerolineae bacterium]
AYISIGYSTNGNLVSSAKDANPAVSDTPRWTTLSWNATTPTSTTLKFQAAASNSSTGPYTFVGPDGTANTYFTSGGSLSQFDGLRYLKYTAYFTTTDSTATPTLADVTVCFNNIAISPTVWNGNTDTNWFVAGNWNPASVPTAASEVIIPTAPSGNRWPTLTGTTTIYTLTLQSSAALTLAQGITLSVNGAVTNDGALAQVNDVPASAMTEFLHITDSSGTIDKYHGVDLTPGGTAMGVTTVQVKGNQSACTTVPADPIIQRCYRIDPTTQTTATVRFWFTEAERNAQTANALKLWHWGPWTQVGTAGNYTYSESGVACLSGSGLACWFQSTGVASYSPFAVGSTTAPTAITLRGFSAISSSSSPVFLIAVILAAATAIGAVAVSRKKRRITLQ